jgi:hypothetical protein
VQYLCERKSITKWQRSHHIIKLAANGREQYEKKNKRNKSGNKDAGIYDP